MTNLLTSPWARCTEYRLNRIRTVKMERVRNCSVCFLKRPLVCAEGPKPSSGNPIDKQKL